MANKNTKTKTNSPNTASKRAHDGNEVDIEEIVRRVKRQASAEPTIPLRDIPELPQYAAQPLNHEESGDLRRLTIVEQAHVGILKLHNGSADSYRASIQAISKSALAAHPGDGLDILESSQVYFYRIHKAVIAAGGQAGQADKVERDLLDAWRCRLAAWLGSSVSFPANFQECIDIIVEHAKKRGALTPGYDLYLAQRDSTEHAESSPTSRHRHFADTPPANVPRDTTNTDIAFQGSQNSQRAVNGSTNSESVRKPQQARPARETDAAPFEVDSQSGRAAQVRFPEPMSLYSHHAANAILQHLGRKSWNDVSRREASQREIADRWTMLSADAHAHWSYLHDRLICGDDSLESFSDEIAALFHNGRALQSLSIQSTNQISMASGSKQVKMSPNQSSPESLTGQSTGAPMHVKVSHATTQLRAIPKYGPQVVPYVHPTGEDTTIYVRSMNFRKPGQTQERIAERVVKLCRDEAGDSDESTAPAEKWYHESNAKTLCIRFNEVQPARALWFNKVMLDNVTLRTFPYPDRAPKIFFTEDIFRTGNRAIQMKNLFTSLQKLFPDSRFHMRRTTTRINGYPCEMWLLMFEKAPVSLRFELPVSLKSDSKGFRTLYFDPVPWRKACPLCKGICGGVRKCGSFVPVTAVDLNVSPEEPHFLANIP